MSATEPGLAKLTRPRLYGAVQRERLFRMLDESRERSAVCIVGPPGAGKTTLIASYLDERQVAGIWYQVDGGDADVATFFYYLRVAAVAAGAVAQPPLLTAEYQHDLPGFARRFFRELFGQLPMRAGIVLDNYHEVPEDCGLHEVVAIAVEELPAGFTLFMISRAHPPIHYARLIANQNVAMLEWDELKLTIEETRAIVAARGLTERGAVEGLYQRSGGWAAALTLLIERGNDPGERVDGVERIFDYFAGQIFSRVDGKVQQFLMSTALLPRLTADMARALTGHPDAGRILEELYRRNLFTHRRPGSEPTYQYHALFQAFLLDRAEQLLPEEERASLPIRAAGLLVGVGMLDEAFVLFVQASAWDAAAGVLCSHAQSLLAQGRARTLLDWAARLPGEGRAKPWVRYWLGMAVMPLRQPEARAYLELAWHDFTAVEDRLGQTLAACGMIESYYREWSEFRSLDRWIEILEDLVGQGVSLGTVEAQLRVHASLLLAMLYRRPGHPSIQTHVRTVFDLLHQDAEPNERLIAATFLISYCALAADLALGDRVIAIVEPLQGGQSGRPYHRYWWLARCAFFRYYEGRYVEGLRMLRSAEELAGQEGFSLHLNFMHYRLVNLLGSRHMKEATALRDKALVVADALGDAQSLWHRWQMQLDLSVAQDATEHSQHFASKALQYAHQSGMIYIELRTLMGLAWALSRRGEQAELDKLHVRVSEATAGTCFSYYEHDLRLCQAWCAINRGDDARVPALLTEALARARRQDAVLEGRWNAAAFSSLLAAALDLGIETEYVRRLVRRYGVQPPTTDLETWPWPVRIHTLGRFELFVDDELVQFEGRAPKRVLALLKAIVAFGANQVSLQQILDALWPQEEADLAHKAFGVALVRLRKLIAHPEAIVVSDQRVSLDPHICWIDAAALRIAVSEAMPESLPTVAALRVAERVLGLYQGTFLPDDVTEHWTIPPRDRLCTRFTQFIERLAGRLEREGQWNVALECYQRALEADDLNEAFYRGQMRCYQGLDRMSDALAVYRRLKRTLEATLGVPPAAETQALAQAISRRGSA